MRNGWSGGQYSVYRALFGAYLVVHFVMLLPWGAELFSNSGVLPDGADSPYLRLFPNVLALADGPVVVTTFLALGVLASGLLAVGYRDRVAAVFLWYLWACLFGRNPLISNPGLPYVGLLLVVHALLPRAPYGSLEARGRLDPEGGWRMSPALFRTVWILMSVGYTYSGFTKLVSPSWRDGSALARVLENPLARSGGLGALLRELPDFLLRAATWGTLALELGFVLLALSRRLRPLAWGAMLAMHLGLILVIDFADLSLGMVCLHLFTFDPAWVRARRTPESSEPETVFYDGECGLCHNTVRMLLAEDRDGEAFRFSPLQGATLARLLTEEKRAALPDSLIVHTHDGRWLMRSEGTAHMLSGLGGAWTLLGGLLIRIPRPLRDAGYDLVAANRKRFFAKPQEACPLLPPRLRERFLP